MSALTLGWDIGGAHLKACVRADGVLRDVAQWPCPLWQGQAQLEAALDAAAARWPWLAAARHALTMTGEMVDLFADREQGVAHIAASLARRWPHTQCYAGDLGWLAPGEARDQWASIASANWLATAHHAARVLGSGVLLDIGSTTTDLIVFHDGRVATPARSDFARLTRHELVYQGVVRTPLCALAPRLRWGAVEVNIMREWFATTADVYRLTGELDPAHDQQPSADGGDKSAPATRQRLARMLGLDARDATDEAWLALARAWRACQVKELADALCCVLAPAPAAASATAVAAGCGAFLVPAVVAHTGLAMQRRSYARDVAGAAPELAAWAEVCAPAVAVASLFDAEVPA